MQTTSPQTDLDLIRSGEPITAGPDGMALSRYSAAKNRRATKLALDTAQVYVDQRMPESARRILIDRHNELRDLQTDRAAGIAEHRKQGLSNDHPFIVGAQARIVELAVEIDLLDARLAEIAEPALSVAAE